MNRYQQQSRGFSLIEVLLASAIFGVMLTVLLGAMFYGQESAALSGNRSVAILYAEEGIEAVRAIQDGDFSRISSLSDGTYYLDTTSGEWELDGSDDTFGNFSRSIELETVASDIVEITSNVTWTQNLKRNGSVSLVTRFANWIANLFSQTTQAEFNAGRFNSTESTNTSGGEVQLETESSWSSPNSFLTYDMPATNQVYATFQEDNTLWVARGDQTLYEIDISDVSSATIAIENSYAIGSIPTSVFVSGNTAVVGTTASLGELVIIDLTGVAANTIVDLPGIVGATDVVIANNKILVTRQTSVAGEFYVYDITGASSLGFVEVGSAVYGLAADDSYAYLATADNDEFWIVDFNTCTDGLGGNECTIETTYDLVSGGNSDTTAIFKVGDNVYLGRDTGGLHGITLSGTSVSTEFLDYDNSNDTITDLYVDENIDFLYAGTDDAGTSEVIILDISTPATPTESLLDADGAATVYGVEKQGAYLYLGSGSNASEIQVYSSGASGWSSPTTIDTYDTTGAGNDALGIAIDGNYAYVTTEDALWSFDISDPSNVQLEDSLSFGYAINDVAIGGNYAYLATSNNSSELVVVDLSNPASLSQVSTYNTNGGQNGLSISISGTYAYIGTENNNGGFSSCTNSEIYAINITNPLSLTCSGSYDIGGSVNDIHADGNYAYLATAENSLEFVILNTTNPAAMSIDDSYNRAGNNDGRSVWYASNVLYGGVGGGGVDVYAFDVTDRTNMTLLASLDNGGADVNDITAISNYLVIPNESNGSEVAIIDASNVLSGTLSNVTTYTVSSGDACFASATDGTYAFLACAGGSFELQVVGPSAASGDYSWEGWFTSSDIDSGSSSTTWDSISWSEGDVGSGGCTSDVVFQLRTAADSGGNPGTWSTWLGPSGSSDYYTDPTGGDTINSTHSDGSNDQWIQYRGYFTSDGTCSKSLEDISLGY